MKNVDLTRLQNGFKLCSNLKGTKFAYAVARNSRLVDVVLGDLRKTVEQDDGFKAFERARIALCQEHAVLDDNSKAKMLANTNQFEIRDQKAFDDDFEKLKQSDDHKEAIDRHTEKLEGYDKLMGEESDYTPYTIPLSEIPADITTGQLQSIYEIIEDS